MTYKTKIAKIK